MPREQKGQLRKKKSVHASRDSYVLSRPNPPEPLSVPYRLQLRGSCTECSQFP